jgi:hypothetical protein
VREAPASRCAYSAGVRIFYVDDSGDETISLIAALTFEFESWPTVLKQWLGWRKWLLRQYGLPVDFELHAQEFISGHGQVPPAGRPPKINHVMGLRQEAYQHCLRQLDRQNGVHVTAIARRHTTVKAVYAEFVEMIDAWLAARGEQGLCIVDGKDDSNYRPAHRALKLGRRAVLEDSLMQSSTHSQLIQSADLVAYAAFQHVDPRNTKPSCATGTPVCWPVPSSTQRDFPGFTAPEKDRGPRRDALAGALG